MYEPTVTMRYHNGQEFTKRLSELPDDALVTFVAGWCKVTTQDGADLGVTQAIARHLLIERQQ
jgi:hypothetical protein